MDPVYPHPIRTAWKLLARLRVDNPTITNTECARQLGTNANTIGAWLRTPLYQSYENFILTSSVSTMPLAQKITRAEMKDELDEFATEMLHRLRDIVETSSDEKLIAQIGFDMLDRAGYAEPKKDAARSINLMLTPELLAILAERNKDIRDTEEVIVGEVVHQLNP